MATSIAEDVLLRFFEHGGRLDAARAAFPDAPQPWLDLSTGISPWSYRSPETPPEEWHRLPDLTALENLSLSARKAYRAPKEIDVVALPGADIGLSLLPWLFRTSRTVAIVGPTYSGHVTAWKAAGHSVSEATGLDDLGSAEIVVVTNPNNPDGRCFTHSDLAEALRPLHRRDGLLIVDEAFVDTDPSLSILPVVNRLDRTVVLRSFGKFYGLAGLRLGFAITSHPVAERLRQAIGAWPVSSAAIAIGQAALNDDEWASAQKMRLNEAAQNLDNVLTSSGLEVRGGTSLFRLAVDPRNRYLFHHLASSGILVRPFRDRSALRIGLPKDDEEIQRLRRVLSVQF